MSDSEKMSPAQAQMILSKVGFTSPEDVAATAKRCCIPLTDAQIMARRKALSAINKKSKARLLDLSETGGVKPQSITQTPSSSTVRSSTMRSSGSQHGVARIQSSPTALMA